jgi:hypothetical protein
LASQARVPLKYAWRVLLGTSLFTVGVTTFGIGFFIGRGQLDREMVENEVIKLEVISLKRQLETTDKLIASKQETIDEAVTQRNSERLRANVFIDSYKSCMKNRFGEK